MNMILESGPAEDQPLVIQGPFLRLQQRSKAMEMYFYPPEDASEPGLTREQVLATLAARGLKANGQEDGSFWVIRFEGSDAFLQCQEKDGFLRFATLDQSMFDDSGIPPRVFEVLMNLGWECDESVG